MTERIKLSEPGAELIMTVGAVSTEKIENTDYVKFEDGSKELLVPAASVTRQYERLGVGQASEIVGKTVKFSRSTKINNFGKPFWNLDLAAAKPPATSGKTAHSMGAPGFLEGAEEQDAADLAAKVGFDTTKIGKDLALYTALTEYVLRDIAPLYEKSKIGMSPESAAAATATLYIQAKR